MNDAHFSYGPHPCDLCEKVSRTKSGLRMHILRNHRHIDKFYSVPADTATKTSNGSDVSSFFC